MADRNARFVREVIEADKLIESYTNRLEQLFIDWLEPMLEALIDADEGIREAILAELRTARFSPELEEHLDNILEVYTEELTNIQGRFSITEDDVAQTEETALIHAANMRAELTTTATAIASWVTISLAGDESIKPRQLIEQFIG